MEIILCRATILIVTTVAKEKNETTASNSSESSKIKDELGTDGSGLSSSSIFFRARGRRLYHGTSELGHNTLK